MTRLPALLGPDLADKATAIAGYYLFDTGGNFTDVVQTAVGIDIPGMLANFNATRDNEIAVRLMLPRPLRADPHCRSAGTGGECSISCGTLHALDKQWRWATLCRCMCHFHGPQTPH